MCKPKIWLFFSVSLFLEISLQQRCAAQTKPDVLSDRERYLQLARSVYTWSDDDTSKNRKDLGEVAEMKIVGSIRKMIQEQVINGMRQSLKQNDIRRALLPFQQISLADDERATNTPLVQCFSLKTEPYCFAAYTILRGGEGIPDSQAYLDFFLGKAGNAEPFGIPASDFRGSRFFVKEVAALVPFQEWVLAWGNRIGDTGYRLNARLYSFDESHVATLWQLNDVSGGVLEVSDDSIRLEYDSYYGAPYIERKVQVFHFTPNGLQ